MRSMTAIASCCLVSTASSFGAQMISSNSSRKGSPFSDYGFLHDDINVMRVCSPHITDAALQDHGSQTMESFTTDDGICRSRMSFLLEYMAASGALRLSSLTLGLGPALGRVLHLHNHAVVSKCRCTTRVSL
jgi:hypothetical protein